MIALTTALRAVDLVAALKAAAEPTRLRILMLLSQGELSVKDLTLILGQSQPRISRHLKLLAEAGLIERFRDGSWAYFHVSERTEGGRLARSLVAAVDPSDTAIGRDRVRAEALKRDRADAAQEYFREHAQEWDRIRTLYVAERDVESAMLEAMGPGPFGLFLDLGTGTGRILELFAGRYRRALGLDVNQSMLAYARDKLSAAGLDTAQVRHGDLYALALQDNSVDAIVMHQVLHYLSEPAHALREAARVLAPGGRLLIVDFAPHDLETLREAQAHTRLGISNAQVEQWFADAGLKKVLHRDLHPSAGNKAQKLTVSLWIGEAPHRALTAQRRERSDLERTP
jgi:ubiquinone/menaquinone biosynthesis C-methylase UbiE/DNA-binding HxlR family transcriptional regulator